MATVTPILYPYDGQDAAADWFPDGADWDIFPPSYDEWNAIRLCTGREPGDFAEYLTELGEWLPDWQQGV